ncbi:hypothetical protein JDV02_005265 [Purpureocillium takamizusanense]|uniref:Translation initiation factor 4E n=1 Tax=Purpureocillium takamizusanense TaxID=2060973 RepID=A0A9Q8QG46_9HYPO|nr:uncharacterized protein JDV02_005265 [Purpureocillium takamizusanense]UNI19045.1 hypothetical protein JDV02_005265 [Purpureocillium takamizusanense]
MSARPQLFTRGLSGLSQSTTTAEASSPAEQRDDAKRNFLKTMRPLPTQHYWNVYFDRQQQQQQQQSKDHHRQNGGGGGGDDSEYKVQLEQLGGQIESVQDFWRYNNNTPVDQIKMRESIYLFKSGFRPVWEDRRNRDGGSWTFRVPKTIGPDVWTRIQLLAIGEKLQSALADGDQLCGVGLSVRFNSHLITVWHRDSSKQASIDGMLACVMDELPPELRPKPDNYFYKRHRDHAGFKAPSDAQPAASKEGGLVAPGTNAAPEVTVEPPSAH